jgi:ABC-type phosphate transport system auxiliary subunit
MTEALDTIKHWITAGEPFAWILTGAVVAACFVIFNALRVFLYIPQIATSWADRQGCPTVKLCRAALPVP